MELQSSSLRPFAGSTTPGASLRHPFTINILQHATVRFLWRKHKRADAQAYNTTALFEKLSLKGITNSPLFNKHEGSRACEMGSATWPYHKPPESSHHVTTYVFRTPFSIILISTPRSPKWFLLFKFCHQKFLLFSTRVASPETLMWPSSSFWSSVNVMKCNLSQQPHLQHDDQRNSLSSSTRFRYIKGIFGHISYSGSSS